MAMIKEFNLTIYREGEDPKFFENVRNLREVKNISKNSHFLEFTKGLVSHVSFLHGDDRYEYEKIDEGIAKGRHDEIQFVPQ